MTQQRHNHSYSMDTFSPDLNPIERKGAQSKAIRKQKNGSVEELFAHSVL